MPLCIDSGCTLGLLPAYWGRRFGTANLCPEDLKTLSLTLPESARCDSCHSLTCEPKINWANKVSSHPPATAIMLYECATGPFSRAEIYVYIHHEYMYIYIFKDTFKFRLMLRQKKQNKTPSFNGLHRLFCHPALRGGRQLSFSPWRRRSVRRCRNLSSTRYKGSQ